MAGPARRVQVGARPLEPGRSSAGISFSLAPASVARLIAKSYAVRTSNRTGSAAVEPRLRTGARAGVTGRRSG